MTMIKAVVRNGRLETEAPIDLPDGTELLIPIVNGTEGKEEGWDNSPKGINDWLKWYESLEPLIFTDEEKSAWHADRQARKDWEKTHFDDYAEKLMRMWK